MKCTPVNFGGTFAILCGQQRINTCVECGAPAPYLCDWKIGHDRTCDKPLCADHATSPKPEKHLCRNHAAMWAEHPRNKQGSLAL